MLWIAVHLYRLSLDVLLPSQADDWQVAVAVMEHDHVTMATQAALRLGVRPGMKRSSAMAIAPGVAFVERDRAREVSAVQAVALALLQYTPEVAHGPQEAVLLKVNASLNLFKGPRALCSRIRQTLSAMGVRARLGMAPSASGAWLLARRPGKPGRRRVLRLESLRRELNRLPCLLLPAAQPYRDWLQDIGCRTLGGLERLPRAELQRRTSPQLIDSLDQSYGRVAELFEWVQPPPIFDQRLELLERIEHAEATIFGARRLIEQLCGWLRARHLAASQVQLVLEHERGRHGRAPTVLPIRLAQPVWQPEHLLRLLAEKLPQLQLPAPVVVLRLLAPQVVSADTPSGTLFDDAVSQQHNQYRLLELLAARLGPEHVLRPVPVADYRPEVANHWVSALEGDRSGTAAQLAGRSQNMLLAESLGGSPIKSPNVRAGLPHPFWLLDEPIRLAVHDGRPVYGSELRLVRGPERIEVGWWDGPWVARDYFVAEDDRAVRYWIFRQREAADAGWYLHGLFA